MTNFSAQHHHTPEQRQRNIPSPDVAIAAAMSTNPYALPDNQSRLCHCAQDTCIQSKLHARHSLLSRSVWQITPRTPAGSKGPGLRLLAAAPNSTPVLYLRLATLSCRLTVGIWYSGRPLTKQCCCRPSARSAFTLRLRVKVLIHYHDCRAPPSHHETHCVGKQGQVQGLFLSRCQIQIITPMYLLCRIV